jgi:hypothetical protein
MNSPLRRWVALACLASLLAVGTSYAPPLPRPAPRPAPHPVTGRPHEAPGGRAYETPGSRPHDSSARARAYEHLPTAQREAAQSVDRGIEQRPAESLERLAREGYALPENVKTRLAVDAVEVLHERSEKAEKREEVLGELRQARAYVRNLPKPVRIALQVVERHAEARYRRGLLKALAGQLGAKDTDAARRTARELLNLPDTPPEVESVLRPFVAAAERAEAVARTKAALQTGDRGAWQAVSAEDLSGQLRAAVQGFRGSHELKAASERSWETPPVAAALRRAVADYREGSGNAGRATQILQDLSARSFLEDHPSEARKLLPRHGDPEHAAALLRDIKVTLAGGGAVHTAPVAHFAVPEPASGGATSRGPPPVLKALVPEGSAEGWRPPVTDRATADLPPLTEAVREEATYEEKVKQELPKEAEAAQTQVRQAYPNIRSAAQSAQREEDDDEKLFKDLEGRLGRPLTGTERALAHHLRVHEKASVTEIESFLRNWQKLMERTAE